MTVMVTITADTPAELTQLITILTAGALAELASKTGLTFVVMHPRDGERKPE